jgi:hypothetical protein
MYQLSLFIFYSGMNGCVQGDLGEKVSIFGSDNIGHFMKKFYMNTCMILNVCRDKDFKSTRTHRNPIDFCLWGWMESEV